jgi:hypothetical protein
MNTTSTSKRRSIVAGTFLLLALAPIAACGTENTEAPSQSIGGALQNNTKSGAFGSADALERRGQQEQSGPSYGGSVPVEPGRSGECTQSARMAERGYIPCMR